MIKHEGKYYLSYSANYYASSAYAVGYAVGDARRLNLDRAGFTEDGKLYIIFYSAVSSLLYSLIPWSFFMESGKARGRDAARMDGKKGLMNAPADVMIKAVGCPPERLLCAGAMTAADLWPPEEKRKGKMRQTINLDKNWKFFLGDLPPKSGTEGWGGAKARGFHFGAAAFDLNDSGWREVDVPHDFVSEGEYTRKPSFPPAGFDMQKIPEMESMDSRHFAGGSLEGGVAWYRKSFEVPKECGNQRVLLYFDGVYRDSTVYLNEYFVGNHAGGYDGFYYDITDFVNMGGKNVLAVRVDASGREGWWYEGGGIYRHVWLEYRDRLSVKPWGVFASARVRFAENQNAGEPGESVGNQNAGGPGESAGNQNAGGTGEGVGKNSGAVSAQITVKTEIESRLFASSRAIVETKVRDKDGNVVCSSGEGLCKIEAAPWEEVSCTQHFTLDNPCLWDLEHPNLYSVTTNLYLCGDFDEEGAADRRAWFLVDSCETEFGIRDIRFDADSGFYLNGKHIKIKGLCCHQDHAGIGIAANESVQEYRIAQMKSMGANAYRSAHHMPDRKMLDLCDRMGMLMFAETRRMSSAPQDLEALRTLVRQGRNHPSVFLWGIGNEEIFSQDRPETVRTTLTMKMEIAKLDGTRPVTSAVVCWNGQERFDNAGAYVPVTKHLDVMGFNYCRQAWDDYHERMPAQPILITEASSNSGTRGCYGTDEETGQYFVLDEENPRKVKNKRKAVKKDVGESEWKSCAERDYLAGIFLWTGMDYRGEPTPLAYPAVYSQFGIFDYCGFPKDNFYYYQSWWTHKPVLHVFPHWNHKGMEGREITVFCYSNLEEVELFVNGKSYGRKTMEKNWYLSWEGVVYEPGRLTAKGYRGGALLLEQTVETTGLPARLFLEPYRTAFGAQDTLILNVSVLDEQGRIVPAADCEIHFEVEGGTVIGTGNGNPGDHSSEKIPVRRAFHGLCQLLVKTSSQNAVKVRAYSDGLIPGGWESTPHPPRQS